MADKNTKHRGCRTQNYTAWEKNFLWAFIEKNKAVIDCKRTDALSNELKDQAWSQLAYEFNSVTDTQRTKRQLQVWWENNKRQQRKQLAVKKDKLLNTGDSGEAVCNLSSDMWDAHVANILMAGIEPLSESAALPSENIYARGESEPWVYETSDGKKKHRMARGQNCTDSEKNILIGLIEKNKAVIECKRTDGPSNQVKDEIWNHLTDEFNAMTETKRTPNQLRVWWGNQKNRFRKGLANKLSNEHVLNAGGDHCNWSTDSWEERVAAAAGFSPVNLQPLKIECESVCSDSCYKSVDDTQCEVEADCSRESVVPLVFGDDSPALSPSKKCYESNDQSYIDTGCSIEPLQSVDNLSVPAPVTIVHTQPLTSEPQCSSHLTPADTSVELEVDSAVPDTCGSVENVERSDMENVCIGLLTEQLETIKNNKEVLMKQCKELYTVRRKVRQWLADMDRQQAELEAQIAEQDIRQKLVEERITQERFRETTFQETELCSNSKDLLGCNEFKTTSVSDVDDNVEERPLIGERDEMTFGDRTITSGSTAKSLVNNIYETSITNLHDDEVICDNLNIIPDMVTKQNSTTQNFEAIVAASALPKSFLCDLCGAVFTNRSSFAYHQSSHRSKNHVCTECNKQFSFAFQLEQHYFVHTGQQPFLCQHCGRSFRRRRLLVLHSKSHSSERTVKCMYCSAAFKRRDGLRRHVAYVHEPHRLLSCTYCNLRFDEQYRLRDHERTHSGDLPFECALCSKRYCSKHSLNNHKLYAHRLK